MPELVYSSECPYCRAAVAAIERTPRIDVELISIESNHGRALVVDHHGTYVHAPHLFEQERVYYGVSPVLRRLTTYLVHGEQP